MQPWKISAGLTAAHRGVGPSLLAGPRLEYLAPYLAAPPRRTRRLARPALWRSHSATVAAAIYAVARAAGLADLGRRVDLAERSVRRGEGDPALTDALRRDAEGDWE